MRGSESVLGLGSLVTGKRRESPGSYRGFRFSSPRSEASPPPSPIPSSRCATRGMTLLTWRPHGSNFYGLRCSATGGSGERLVSPPSVEGGAQEWKRRAAHEVVLALEVFRQKWDLLAKPILIARGSFLNRHLACVFHSLPSLRHAILPRECDSRRLQAVRAASRLAMARGLGLKDLARAGSKSLSY